MLKFWLGTKGESCQQSTKKSARPAYGIGRRKQSVSSIATGSKIPEPEVTKGYVHTPFQIRAYSRGAGS